jgi:hypothetical protein
MLLSFTINREVSKPKNEWRFVRSLRRVDVPSFWKEVFYHLGNFNDLHDVDEVLSRYDESTTVVLNQMAPLKKIRCYRQSSNIRVSGPTLTIKRKMRRSEQLWRSTRLTVHRDIFKADRNAYIKSLIHDKKQFIRKKLIDVKGNSRQVWSQLAMITGRYLKMSRMHTNQATSDGCLERAQKLAEFFTMKISTIVSSLAATITNDLPMDNVSFRTNSLMTTFDTVTITDVKMQLKEMPTLKKSPNDLIPPGFMKHNHEFMLFAVRLCNTSFGQGIFPQSLKKAIITPVMKNTDGDADDLANYRPVSNLKVFSKLIEKLAASQLTRHIEKIGFLHPNQSAYRRGHSTETATFKVFSEWCEHLDNNKLIVIASLDVSAAFDTISHQILLYRLKQAGILGLSLKWFTSYLCGRKAEVKVGNASSKPFDLLHGVPQGSVLGPILFNLYMSDLAFELHKEKVLHQRFVVNFHIYADDVILFVSCSKEDINDALQTLTALISKVDNWMKGNGLLLNAKKTRLHFLSGKRFKSGDHNISVRINGEEVKFDERNTLRWLGVDFDSKLSMRSFVSNKCRICFAILRMLRRIRPFINHQSAALLANSLILSRIDYCSSLINNVDKEMVKKCLF